MRVENVKILLKISLYIVGQFIQCTQRSPAYSISIGRLNHEPTILHQNRQNTLACKTQTPDQMDVNTVGIQLESYCVTAIHHQELHNGYVPLPLRIKTYGRV
ncbi:hypothetical protein PoB_005049000 [Plakobranchus ocellatus]|uniref:Secreted protein n=1 Tax=Plakobranchus ocellatus TaxID=259542 RepID=A0AAV4BXU6_9GAST|nr:hypothetical protein PoB_005049000 [Plakobranchus ocellatus]